MCVGIRPACLEHIVLSLIPCFCVSVPGVHALLCCCASAEDGDYWRLLTPGLHILTATASGYNKAVKRVNLPRAMTRAGRVDFVLKKVPYAPDEDDLYIPGLETYERFDPYNQFESYSQRELGENGEERLEKPWWWAYFTQTGDSAPTWLLRN